MRKTLSDYISNGGKLEDVNVQDLFLHKMVYTIRNIPFACRITNISYQRNNPDGDPVYSFTMDGGFQQEDVHGNYFFIDEVLDVDLLGTSEERKEIMDWFNKLPLNDLKLIKQNWEDDV